MYRYSDQLENNRPVNSVVMTGVLICAPALDYGCVSMMDVCCQAIGHL
jgi:hypothetical protein